MRGAMAFPFVLFYQEYIENVVGAAIGRPYSFIHKHGGRPVTAPTGWVKSLQWPYALLRHLRH